MIAGLSRCRSLFVIARGSSFSYKGEAIDPRAVARDLGVRYLLTGSLQRAGARFRVSTELIEAGSGSQIWAERYDRESQDIFALQGEITEAILGALVPEIGAAEAARAQVGQAGRARHLGALSPGARPPLSLLPAGQPRGPRLVPPGD